MKELALTLTLLLTVFGTTTAQSSPSSFDRTSVSEAISRITTQFPAATLRDIYKSFFQDAYGPGHLQMDPERAFEYMRRELAEADSFPGPLTEPTGAGGRFLRVNLSVVADSIVPIHTYFSTFIDSAALAEWPPIDQWTDRWHAILDVVTEMGLDSLPNFDEDRSAIDANLANGQYWGDHSKAFVDNYGIHYRIMHRDLFDRRIRPLLEGL